MRQNMRAKEKRLQRERVGSAMGMGEGKYGRRMEQVEM